MQKVFIASPGGEPAEHVRGGLLVSTQDAKRYTPKRIFLTNDAGSPNANVDGSVGGSSDGIHDGTDSALWTGSALSGVWDFASTAQAKAGTKSIDATGTVTGDQALLSRASAISSSSYAVITGSVYLDSYNASKHEISLQLRLAGVNDGGAIDVGDYIDTSTTGAWQDFVIPLTAFGVTGNIDELVITTINSGGANPDYYLDELYFKQTGSVSFRTELDAGSTVQYKTVEITIADADSSAVTVAGSTENTTGAGISYNSMLGVPALANGITFRRIRDEAVVTSGNLASIGDVLIGGGTIVDHLYDGTNTFLRIVVEFADWIELHERRGDILEAVINDDLSGLLDLKFAINARVLEVENGD